MTVVSQWAYNEESHTIAIIFSIIGIFAYRIVNDIMLTEFMIFDINSILIWKGIEFDRILNLDVNAI
jgi:hypothetical protein